MSFSVTPFGVVKASRCWEGYEPVPGKKPYSKGSCRPKGTKIKVKTKAAGYISEYASILNPLNTVAHLPAALVAALTRTRTAHDQAKADDSALSNLLIPGVGPYNQWKRYGYSIRNRDLLKARDNRNYPEYQTSQEKKATALARLQLLLTKQAVGPAAPQQTSGLDAMKARMARQRADLERMTNILKANNMTSGTFVQGQLQLPGGATPKPALPPASQDYTNHELLSKIVQQRRQQMATGATPKPALPPASQDYTNHALLSKIVQQRRQMPRQPNPANQIENESVTSRSLKDILRQRQAPKAPTAPKMPASGIPNKSYTSPGAADFLKKRGSEGGAWTRAEGKSESGGLNAKGRASLKAQGQDIKPPVTESNPTGERADRKKSFCARMSGHKAKNTSAETARDPDSRINKALRKWKC